MQIFEYLASIRHPPMVVYLRGGLIILTGYAALLAGVFIYFLGRSQAKRWPKTVATVRNAWIREGAKIVTIEFLDTKGRVQTVSTSLSNSQHVGLGSQVEIAYDGIDPKTAFICERAESNMHLLACFGVGITCIVLGAVMILIAADQ